MESQGDHRLGHRPGLGETVHHPPYFGRALFPHESQRVVGRLARMDDERLAAFAGGAYVGSTAIAVHDAITSQAVIIEPRFAARDTTRIARVVTEARLT